MQVCSVYCLTYIFKICIIPNSIVKIFMEKKMKRTSKLILTLALSASMAFGVVSFAACGNTEQKEEHKHTYATTWSSDADNHWHAPTCDDTTEVKDKAAHVDADLNGKCDVCEHDVPIPHQHTYATEWSSDADNHWHAPTCDDTTELKDKAAHIDENNDYKCDVCGYDLPQPEEGTAITIVANSTADIEINLEEGVYELSFILDAGVTATRGGLTAHVNGSTTDNIYDMYEGHNETYYAVLFVRADSTAITLTNTTGDDISAHYTLETYEIPTLKADGTEYVLPMLVTRTGHNYRSLFTPIESLSGTYRITVSNVSTTYNGTSFTVFKNGSTSTATGRLISFTSDTSWGPREVDMTGVNSLLFRAGSTATGIDYNITVKIEPVA